MAVMSCRGCGSVFKSESLAQAGVLFDEHSCADHPFVAGQIDRRFSDAVSDSGDHIWSGTDSNLVVWLPFIAVAVVLISVITVLGLLVFSGESH